jgi:hypothetical protein
MGFLRQGKPKKITDHNERYMSAICTISIRPSVGADLSRTPPMYRPGERIDGPLADTSALRQ